MGDEPDGPVQRLADGLRASSTSTASSAARRTSTRRRSTATRFRSSSRRPPEEGYHFTEDMTDQAIDWIRQQKALMPDKPFFVYFAPGATHAPHHVRPEWSDKYKGTFDDGWDALRERTFAKQKELGVIPPDAELTERPDEIPAWDDMPDDLKPVLARQMEVYAGFLEHTDHHVGRLVDSLCEPRDPREHARLLRHRRQRRVGRGNAERLLQRARHPERRVRARDDRVHGLAHRRLRHARRLQPLRRRVGARDGHAVPVDEASRLALGRHAERHDRPLAGRHQGARRGPRAVPPRDRRGADRARGRRPPAPTERQRRAAGAARRRLDGVLVRRRGRGRSAHDAVLRDVLQPRHLPRGLDRRHTAQHAVGARPEMPAFDDDVWELYGPDDWTQAHDLAAEQPEKLARAPTPLPDRGRRSTTCFPLDDRRFERFNPDLAGRPQLVQRHVAAPLRWHGPAVRELGRRDQEQVARDHGRDRRARRQGPRA